ncbi:hypothetical protein [Aliterella atlantica]|uniref:Uncharacterized protein n=1 Tax=Aliterella atlantica CENA595 TaxID=1618023 RepID=A0A0D8ZQR9_9CYAN|nr:hypothetical protein [Aliterella atlantica]KJH70829.1 hypothetical protein UH38_15625 [Aliterella atlantica CENA595]
MANQTLFIVKLLVVSVIVSVAIKFVPLSVPATTTNALIGILTPTLLMAIALLSRYAFRQQRT